MTDPDTAWFPKEHPAYEGRDARFVDETGTAVNEELDGMDSRRRSRVKPDAILTPT